MLSNISAIDQKTVLRLVAAAQKCKFTCFLHLNEYIMYKKERTERSMTVLKLSCIENEKINFISWYAY